MWGMIRQTGSSVYRRQPTMISAFKIESIRDLIDYRPRTGRATWKMPHSWCGHPVGWMSEDGVMRVTLDGQDYPLHSVIWAYPDRNVPNGQRAAYRR